MIDTAEITSKLNAADPTIVEGPSCPGVAPKVRIVSIRESKISGALYIIKFKDYLDPRAIRVRLAIVGFQTVTLILCFSPCSSSTTTSFVCEVMTSMDLREKLVLYSYPMKISEIIAMPKNR